MIYPYLLYCNLAWGKANLYILDPLLKSQKRAVRLVCGLRKFDSTSASFIKLNIMKFHDLYIYSTNIFMYKFNHNDLPCVFNDFFYRNQSYHSHQTRQKENLRIPLVKTAIANSFIKKQGALLWNETIKKVTWKGKLGSFKKAIKRYIIDSY